MRRADRLFQIVQILRRRRLTTARQLADRLCISERTVYRDIRDLIASGVPVEGEAGVGYRLRGFDLPPLMFTREEVEALVLGARIVQSWTDPELAGAAAEAIAKIEAVLPQDRSHLVQGTQLYAPEAHFRVEISVDLPALRRPRASPKS
jgi:predicted DNA-binding transcriptional regulator YafY